MTLTQYREWTSKESYAILYIKGASCNADARWTTNGELAFKC